MPNDIWPLPRRSFFSRLAAGVAAFSGASNAPTVHSTPASSWEPARHPQDDWLEAIPGKHRYFFDSSTANGAGEAITFASNYFVANKGAYALEASELAVVICLRHWSTPFAYSDSVWAKYGAVFAERIKFNDPRTNAPPTVNVYNQSSYGMSLPNRGTTLDSMVAKGVHFAVCDMATHAYAGMVAGKMGLKADDVYAELKASAIGNSHFVPAGIVAVNRAQERGYSIISMH